MRPWLASALLALLAQPMIAAAADVRWAPVRQELVDQLNADLKPGELTADIGIYFPSNLDPQFASRLRIEDLVLEFAMAKRVFRAAGVELKLLWIKTGRVDPQYLEIQANDMSGTTPGGQYVNMYEDNVRETSVLSAEARSAFESIVEKSPANARTVYLVVLQDIFMSFFEKLDERTWELRTITTGGLSFPGYSYHTIPRRLRGVITINKTEPLRRIVAHELGHKLMNVSHEYRSRAPSTRSVRTAASCCTARVRRSPLEPRVGGIVSGCCCRRISTGKCAPARGGTTPTIRRVAITTTHFMAISWFDSRRKRCRRGRRHRAACSLVWPRCSLNTRK